MYASVTTVRDVGPDVAETARMAAESMLTWLQQFDGYQGLEVLVDRTSGSARFLTFWDTREAAERSARGRAQVRDSMIEAAGARLEGTELVEVVLLDRR